MTTMSTLLVLLAAVLVVGLPAGAASSSADARDEATDDVEVRAASAGAVRVARGQPAPSTSPSPAVPDTPLRDPYRPQQWHLDRLGLTADRRVPDGAGQVIAILDSGVDLDHPDLADVLVRTGDGAVVGRDFVDDDDDPGDEFGHGTMVAGIAAGRTGNGLGIAGTVSGRVELLPVRVLDADGQGSSSTVADGLEWAVAQGATVVNLSLESAGLRGVDADPALRRAVDDAAAAGVVVVVAAGNSDAPSPTSAPRDGVVVVGATDRADERAGFSDRGRRDLLMAPGVEIVSTWCVAPDAPDAGCDGTTHSYGIADGTSFAAPQVSGLVAMLASAGLTPQQAVDRLAATTIDLAVPGPDPDTGRGLVSAANALGGWPDTDIEVVAPEPLASPGVPADGPGDASPQAVAPADPPPESDLPTQVLVLVAILTAVGLLVHGLAGGRARGEGTGGHDD